MKSTGGRSALLAAALLVAVVVASTPPLDNEASGATLAGVARTQPDIVFILTDDQRFDTLWAMDNVRTRLQKHGITFRNGIISDPLCCPSRSTILTGRTAGGHGVWSNTGAFGGWRAFHDGGNEDHTIAKVLDDAGYRTALVGKYLNRYDLADGAVPPGWDRWFAIDESNARYYDYSVIDVTDGVGARRFFGDDPSAYSTDVISRTSVRFIRQTPADKPIFLYASVAAPHGPSIPAPGDLGAFDGQPWQLPPSFNERDVRDKPRYVRDTPRADAHHIERVRRRVQLRAESLLAVDRMVEDILSALRRTGRLDNTMIVFMSDNGFLQLEHRLTYKVVPYEESIRVPFVVRFDAAIAGTQLEGTTSKALVSNLDLAPTWATLAGTTMDRPVEGVSFAPLLAGERRTRKSVLLESLEFAGGHTAVPSYCGLRRPRYVYVRYGTGEQEFYDLRSDPYQLQNLARRAPSAMGHMRVRTKALCVPTPPGYEWGGG